MDKNEVRGFLGGVLGKNNVVAYEQIPNIDLYMDQLTTFIDERLYGYKRYRNDKILTKTMINNYTKDGILPPPEKKKYNREQIALLIIIYHLKAGISINDISLLFDVVEEKKIGVERLYREFVEIQERETANIEELMMEKFDMLEGSPKDETLSMLSLILTLISESNSRKQLAERLIDKMFAVEKLDKAKN